MYFKSSFSYVLQLWAVLLCTLSSGLLAGESTESPLLFPGSWQQLKYSSIPPNAVRFVDGRMTIAVNKSASPLIYPLARPTVLKQVTATLTIKGDLNLAGQSQGEKGADDFLFRLGVVYEGERRMNMFQRAIAPSWIKTLYDLAPNGTGVDSIAFYNVYSDARLTGQKRTHPASDLMKEYFVQSRSDSGHVNMIIQPNPNRRVLGLWLSSDGDDTSSTYSVEIQNLALIKP